ncbi:MAG: hypothetical protein OEX02_18540 [Cyclobacteriaceae bacterium]|nr:hypothetical protein [Cyclobacteriaceae bacterium]
MGLGDYQVRSWHGFHRHMTLSFMAFYYMFLQKLKFEEKNNLVITAPVIRKLIASAIRSLWETIELAIDAALIHIENYNKQINPGLCRDG